jgi:protein-tyrosine phosphatase
MSGILVVCTGNVCRSPMAEGFLRAALVQRLGRDAPVVSSAGTAGWEGSGATNEAIAAARERGVDVGAHRARVLSRALIDDAELVVCMTGRHRAAVAAIDPEALDRTFTIAELARLLEAGRPTGTIADRVASAAASRNGLHHGDLDVRDPLGDPIDGYREVAQELEALAERIADTLVGRPD